MRYSVHNPWESSHVFMDVLWIAEFMENSVQKFNPFSSSYAVLDSEFKEKYKFHAISWTNT